MFAKTLKYLILAFLISTHKTLPLAYVVRFYYHAIRGFFALRSYYLRTKRNSFGYNSPKDLFTWITLDSYVTPLELDVYMHKLNSTYFLDLDIARTKLLTRLFQTYWWWSYDNGHGKGKKKHSLSNIPYVPVATVQCQFKRELKLFQKFKISSRVLAWDKKWLFVMSKFVTDDNKVTAIAITKYVFKVGRLTIAPEEYIKLCNFWDDENQAINAKNYELVKYLVDVEDIEKIAEAAT
ncbi:hypothetical protein Cantr_03925 [Candida viswanathii]|uniref:Protein THEM6 n=1 Tax=Candida viswanathii TaxID=5486 RepID=A0A367XQL1_9ASCO|nr:hypothetical protein Cantr_03925 [Candida viswanathii]